MDCDEIQFKEDGSWAPMRSKKEVQEVSSASCNNGLDGKAGCMGMDGGGRVLLRNTEVTSSSGWKGLN